ARCDEPFDIFRLKISWQSGQTPMSHSGNGPFQLDGALAFGDHEPHKHAKHRCARFCCCPASGATFLQNERPQPACVKPAGLLSEPSEQVANMNAVVVERRITGTPLLAHPLT